MTAGELDSELDGGDRRARTLTLLEELQELQQALVLCTFELSVHALVLQKNALETQLYGRSESTRRKLKGVTR